MTILRQQSGLTMPYRFTDYLGEVIAAVGILFVVAFPLLANFAQSLRNLTLFENTLKSDHLGHPVWPIFIPALFVTGYAILTAFSRWPNIFIYPKPITAENAPRYYRLMRGAMIWLKAEFCVTYPFPFLYLAYHQYPPFESPLRLILTIVPLILFVITQSVVLVSMYRIK